MRYKTSIIMPDGASKTLYQSEIHLLSNGSVYILLIDDGGHRYMYFSSTQAIYPLSSITYDANGVGKSMFRRNLLRGHLDIHRVSQYQYQPRYSAPPRYQIIRCLSYGSSTIKSTVRVRLS